MHHLVRWLSIWLLLGLSSWVPGHSQAESVETAITSSTISSATASTSVIEQPSEKKPQSQVLQPQATQPSLRAETPPTASDGVQPQSQNAFWLLIPWRDGFTMQPQAEQYIKVGTNANLNVQTAGSLAVLPTSANISMTQWTLQANNTWLKSTNPETFHSGTSLVGLHGTTISKSGLAIGTYYFQMAVTYSGTTYYSQLAKVGVLDTDHPATGIAIEPSSSVVFANADYTVTANLTPSNSTSNVTWTGTNVTYLPTTGRTVRFKTGEVAGVNDSTTDPGLPLNLTGSANGLSASKPVYVGGLKAQTLSEDTARAQGITWKIDGLSALVNQYQEDHTWTYKWVYYDSTGAAKDFAAGEATNTTGTLTNIGDLNTTKLLTIPANSTFITKAVTATKNNQPFSVKLVLTTSNNGNDLKIPTNQARLRVTPSTGKLVLKQVPTFDFGAVAASQIYQGNSSQSTIQPTASQALEITDTRVGKDWQLQAKMGKMASGAQSLNQVALNLTGFPNTASKQLTDQSTLLTLLTSDQTNAGVWTINARLQLGANPTVQLTNQTAFQSNITWALTSSSPTVPSLT